MSDHLALLASVTADLSRQHVPDGSHDAGPVATAFWDELVELGFVTLTVPESLSGSGGDLRDAAAVLRAAAAGAMPLSEALFLAGPALSAARLDWPGGIVTAAVCDDVEVHLDDTGRASVSGTVPRVPWLREADHLVLVAEGRTGVTVLVLAADSLRAGLETGANLAGEPRDTVRLHQAGAIAAGVVEGPCDTGWFTVLEAVGRATQIAGVGREVLELTARHVTEREQFGRRLVAFQAVQHQLARLAESVALVEMAADAAVLAAHDAADRAPFLGAVAKAESSYLVRDVTAIAHQLHGAIGFTAEHRLGALTKRLWSWREELGNEQHWHGVLVDRLEASTGTLWELVTGVPDRIDPEETP